MSDRVDSAAAQTFEPLTIVGPSGRHAFQIEVARNDADPAQAKQAAPAVSAGQVEVALMSGGVIILITAAGGAYGGMLTRAQIGTVLADYAAALGLPVLLLAFLHVSRVGSSARRRASPIGVCARSVTSATIRSNSRARNAPGYMGVQV